MDRVQRGERIWSEGVNLFNLFADGLGNLATQVSRHSISEDLTSIVVLTKLQVREKEWLLLLLVWQGFGSTKQQGFVDLVLRDTQILGKILVILEDLVEAQRPHLVDKLLNVVVPLSFDEFGERVLMSGLLFEVVWNHLDRILYHSLSLSSAGFLLSFDVQLLVKASNELGHSLLKLGLLLRSWLLLLSELLQVNDLLAKDALVESLDLVFVIEFTEQVHAVAKAWASKVLNDLINLISEIERRNLVVLRRFESGLAASLRIDESTVRGIWTACSPCSNFDSKATQ